MLVLSRKESQTILLDESVEITILEIDGSSVKLGINAPDEVRVLRGELREAIREQEDIARRLAEEGAPQAFNSLRDLLIEEEIHPSPKP